MKHILLTAALLSALCTLQPVSATTPIRVLSDRAIGQGFSPRISADASQILYVEDEHTAIAEPEQDPNLYVTNEDLNVVLYRNGVRTVLNPRGDINYVWSSISPDGTRILFTTKYGTEVCDLQGRILANLGHVNAPQWYGNDYVVGHQTTSDSHQFTSACIVMAKADGSSLQCLTDASEFGMYPSVSPATGRIAYSTLEGEMHLLQINMADEPISNTLPSVQVAPRAMQMAPAPARARKSDPSQLKIYINPGHGGHTGNDRPMHIIPFAVNDPNSFWESNSNLDKGLRLRDILQGFGIQTRMSRIYNEEEDDLDLDVIVAQANAYNADFMLSIHSNAGGPSNYILQLYAGRDPGDNTTYRDMGQKSDESRAITTLMGNILYENEATVWSYTPQIRGDKTFARTIMGWSNGYGVLRNLRVPGTISEGCMHDYLPETYRLMNMDYKWRESYYFARTFLEYFLDMQFPTGAIGGQVRDVYKKLEDNSTYKPRTGSRDELLPLHGAKVYLVQGTDTLQTYTTDSLYNGIYFFWDLTPGTYEVIATANAYYDERDTIEVTAGHISYFNALLMCQRQTPPVVLSYSPCVAITDSVQVSTELVFNFNWDMRTDSTAAALSITPAVEGTITFENAARTMRFTPNGRFEPGTEYTVTLSTQACHPDLNWPNHMTAPFTFSFRTMDRGQIRFLQSYPANGETDVPIKPSFVMIFDQSIVASTARSAMSLVDIEGNEVSVNTRSMSCNKAPSPYGSASFEPTSALLPARTYELTIAGTLKDNIGIYLCDPEVIRFTTAASFTPQIAPFNTLDTLVFVADREQSVGCQSVATLRNTTSKKYDGCAATNELQYKFNATEAEAVFVPKNPSMLTVTSADRVGMYVFSDYSGNEFYAKFETAGDIKYVKICDFDYAGWRWQELDLSSLPEGVEMQLMALRVVRSSSLLSGAGSVYLNKLCFTQASPTAVEELEATAEVSKVIRDGQVLILRAGRLYDALGRVVE